MHRRRPDSLDALGALTLLTAAMLGWVALTARPPAVDQLLEARTKTMILAPITVVGTVR